MRRPAANSDPIAEVTGLSVSIGHRPVLREVNLSVHPGEVVAVVGANGSGKSTLIKAMVGLRAPARGQVHLFGAPIGRHTPWERLGYVPQTSTAAQGVSANVAEIVATGRLARRAWFMPMRRKDREAIVEALTAVGLQERARHPMSTLSGGQQQRVLIARALVGRPDLLVLDEPNAGVDLPSQDAIASVVADLAASGVTVVLVLHELGPYADLIDHTLLLREGRVAYDGPADQIPLSRTPIHHHRQTPSRPSIVPELFEGGG